MGLEDYDIQLLNNIANTSNQSAPLNQKQPKQTSYWKSMWQGTVANLLGSASGAVGGYVGGGIGGAIGGLFSGSDNMQNYTQSQGNTWNTDSRGYTTSRGGGGVY